MPTPTDIGSDMLLKKARGEIKSQLEGAIATESVKGAASQTVKRALSLATLFVDFVDTYSKAVKAANLEHIRKWVEFCPHIGGCQNNIDAMSLVRNQEVTAWQGPDGYWYFHPQQNKRVLSAMKIYRWLPDRGTWAEEKPGSPRVQVADCIVCVLGRMVHEQS